MKSVKTEGCVCVLRDLAPQIRALIARMKNTSVSLHLCLMIKFQLSQIWQIQIWFLLFTHTFAKRSLFTSLRITHVFFSRESILNLIGSWSPSLLVETTSVTTVKTPWVEKQLAAILPLEFQDWVSFLSCLFTAALLCWKLCSPYPRKPGLFT